MEHAFNTNIAKEFDVNIAILLQNFKFWTLRNLANKKHIHDGLCWTYNSIQALCKIFPYWTRHQIEHLISKCKKLDLIVAGNYNSHKYDRTAWYALTPKAYALFPELQEDEFVMSLCISISEKSEMSKINTAISENSEQLVRKFRETVLKIPRPIPDTITDNKTDNIYTPSHKKVIKPQFGLTELKEDNPHEIDDSMLSDWLDVRKEKKSRVTATAWSKINKTLTKIKSELGIKPKDAFETMVAAGWLSMELKYFENKNYGSKDSQGSGIRDSSGQTITWD